VLKWFRLSTFIKRIHAITKDRISAEGAYTVFAITFFYCYMQS